MLIPEQWLLREKQVVLEDCLSPKGQLVNQEAVIGIGLRTLRHRAVKKLVRLPG